MKRLHYFFRLAGEGPWASYGSIGRSRAEQIMLRRLIRHDPEKVEWRSRLRWCPQ